MSSQNLEYLLSSPFENDRIKVIYFIVKNKRVEFSGMLKKMAASDESLNVRYYARKAFSFLESLNEESREETIESGGSDEQAIRQKAIRDKILELGESENPENRMKAVRAAIKYKVEGSLEFLMRRLLIETDENVVATIIKSLGATGDKSCTNILIKYLKNADYRIVANSIEALAMLEDERSFPYVISLLSAPSQDNRITANIIEYLKKYDIERAMALLEEMIKFPSDAMVDSAVFVLAGFKSKKVVPLLEQIKNHKNTVIAKKAEAAIKLINSSGGQDISIETLAHNISMPPAISQNVPEKSESEKKIELIRNMLSNPTDQKVINELSAVLKNEKDEYVLAYAITACSKVQGTRNISTLKKFLSHENPRIRANTVEVLGELEGIDLLSLMKPLLKDANNRVRANAIVALKKYPNIDHVSLISEMIKSNDKLMVTSAIYSIIQIKADTIELLKDLVKNPDEEIKERAMSALDFLGNDLNDLNAKKLLNELGIGTKNISKSAEYIFSKTVLDQLDVAYNDNISDVSLLSNKKKEENFSMNDLKRWWDLNSAPIMNVAMIVL
ncbi:MAG TPA: HEAT repeat domain-containing protein, partial [Candidatus Wallbacteria bacterium]|nr:HEAT repeat domain-containing protein [Candidatus Wallbacteria bacterium]